MVENRFMGKSADVTPLEESEKATAGGVVGIEQSKQAEDESHFSSEDIAKLDQDIKSLSKAIEEAKIALVEFQNNTSVYAFLDGERIRMGKELEEKQKLLQDWSDSHPDKKIEEIKN